MSTPRLGFARLPFLRSIPVFALALILGAFGTTAARAQSFVQFAATYDFGTLNASDQAKFQATVQSALNYYSATLSTPAPLTVKILFKADESVGLGQSSTYYSTVSYSSFRSALTTNATSASDTTALSLLPNQSTNPVNGSTTVSASLPLLRALGYNASVSQPDSTVSLKTSLMNLDRTTIDAAKYDLKAVVFHEVDEVLGFGSALNGLSNGAAAPTGAIGTLDLFRYNSNGSGTRSFTTSAGANASFSINGTTLLTSFNQNAGGDFHDFTGGIQVQNAFATPGATPNLGTAELTALDVIGYTVSAIPEPSSVALLAGIGAIGFVGYQRARSRAKRS
jgi:hypothetical protein